MSPVACDREPPAASGREVADAPPGSPTEVELLIARMEQLVRGNTHGGVCGLEIRIDSGGVVLDGRCRTYYCKQLAQHAVMSLAPRRPLVNLIEVR